MCKKTCFAILLILVWIGSAYAAELAHRWSFNGDLVDSVGGQDAVIVEEGGDAVISASEVTLGGGTKGSSDYIDLPDGIVNSVGDSVTFEIWATQEEVQNWSRIFDFGTSTTENLFMSWTVGETLGTDRVEWVGDENSTVNNSNPEFELGVEFHIAMVIDGPNDLVTWYAAESTDESLGSARDSMENTNKLSELEYTNCWLGQSQWGDNTASASFNEFRIWQGCLTAGELQKYHTLGPDIIDPGQAGIIAPEKDETDVALDIELEWSAGYYAANHDLYVGTDYDAVVAASRSDATGTLIAEQDLTGTTYSLDGELALDGIYYWRVDAVNEPPNPHIFEGDVWTFSAEPTYLNPVPVAVSASTYDVEEDYNCPPENTINGSGLNGGQHSSLASTMWRTTEGEIAGAWIQYEFESLFEFNQMHVWNYNGENEAYLGVGAKDVVIKTSVDGETWTTLSELQLSRATGTGTYTGEDVDMGDVVAQYVRIEIQSQHAFPGGTIVVEKTGLSAVQFECVPIAARRPSPADEASVTSIMDELVWRLGRDVEASRLYLGSDANLVAAADDSVFIEEITNRSYTVADTGAMYGGTYYWRVDQVAGDEVTPGVVWSFDTPEYLVIDDMESYDLSNLIYETWKDGYDVDENGSEIGDGEPYVEQEIAFSGSQSMPMYYDTTDGEEAAWVELPVDSDIFTSGGVAQFSVMFKSERKNDNGQFYVEINEKRIYSPASLTSGLWTQLIVDLSEFGNLNSADSLTLGVEGQNLEGVVYIDDVCLYVEAPSLAIPTSEQPSDDALELLFEMEGNLEDSSPNNRDGQSATGATLFYEGSLSEGAIDLGDALALDGVEDMYVDINDPIAGLLPSLTDSTFAAWVSLEEDTDQEWVRVFDFGSDAENYMFLCPRIAADGSPEFGIALDGTANEQDVAGSQTLTTGWHHLAVTIAQGDPNGTLTLYVDGVAVDTDETDTMPADLGATSNNWLGRSQFDSDGYYDGLMDEVRIYSEALSEAEIRWLAGDQ